MAEPRTRAAAIVAVVVIGWALAGCTLEGGGGPLRIESIGPDPVVLIAGQTISVYDHQGAGGTTFMLTDIPLRALLQGQVLEGQVMHVELLWEPKPGATPMDASATNISIRHVVMVDGELGLYGGAGFARTKGEPGQPTVQVTIYDATMRLLEATDGFVDPLTPARITGTFIADHEAVQTRRVRRAISQVVTNALGSRRYVFERSARPPGGSSLPSAGS